MVIEEPVPLCMYTIVDVDEPDSIHSIPFLAE